jgi:hypothetical protein
LADFNGWCIRATPLQPTSFTFPSKNTTFSWKNDGRWNPSCCRGQVVMKAGFNNLSMLRVVFFHVYMTKTYKTFRGLWQFFFNAALLLCSPHRFALNE